MCSCHRVCRSEMFVETMMNPAATRRLVRVNFEELATVPLGTNITHERRTGEIEVDLAAASALTATGAPSLRVRCRGGLAAVPFDAEAPRSSSLPAATGGDGPDELIADTASVSTRAIVGFDSVPHGTELPIIRPRSFSVVKLDDASWRPRHRDLDTRRLRLASERMPLLFAAERFVRNEPGIIGAVCDGRLLDDAAKFSRRLTRDTNLPAWLVRSDNGLPRAARRRPATPRPVSPLLRRYWRPPPPDDRRRVGRVDSPPGASARVASFALEFEVELLVGMMLLTHVEVTAHRSLTE
jgi:hypothetical protein